MYTLKTYDGMELKLSETEANAILTVINQGTQKNVIVQGNYFAVASISSLTQESANLNKTPQIDRSKQQIGMAPGGEVIVKRYGLWYYHKSHNPYQYDDRGQCTLQYTGHPLVPTPEEYESKFKHLDTSLWVEHLTQTCDEQEIKRLESLERKPSSMERVAPMMIGGSNLEICEVYGTFKTDCGHCGANADE